MVVTTPMGGWLDEPSCMREYWRQTGKGHSLIIAQVQHHMKRKSEMPVRNGEIQLPEVMEAKDFIAESHRLRPSRCGALFGDDCCELPQLGTGIEKRIGLLASMRTEVRLESLTYSVYVGPGLQKS